MQTLQYKSKQFFFVLIKISLVVIAFYFIYHKLTKNSDLQFSVFIDFLNKKNGIQLKTICFLLILTGFNWFFEVLKWKELVKPLKEISFHEALKQCLGSLTASLLTPNRIGEYGAKALYFRRSQRKHVLLINLLSNLLQMLITVVLGLIGLFFLTQKHALNIKFNYLSFALLTGVITISLIFVAVGKNSFSFKGFALEKIKRLLTLSHRKSLILGFVFSFVRYSIFSFQFYYLLKLFSVDISYFEAMTYITSMYFFASIIPSIFIFDVVIKGGVAAYLFSLIGVNELIILSIVTMMWLLNFVIPSIYGSYYVLNFNFQKETKSL